MALGTPAFLEYQLKALRCDHGRVYLPTLFPHLPQPQALPASQVTASDGVLRQSPFSLAGSQHSCLNLQPCAEKDKSLQHLQSRFHATGEENSSFFSNSDRFRVTF